MNLREIYSTFHALTKHFDYMGANKEYSFKKETWYPKGLEKRTNFEFLETKTPGSVRAFLVYLVFNKEDNLYRAKEIFKSPEFIGFSFYLKNYKQRFIKDLTMVREKRVTFDQLFEMYYFRQIQSVSFYYISMFLFKEEANKKIKNSNIFYDMFYRCQKLNELMNVDVDFVKSEIEKQI